MNTVVFAPCFYPSADSIPYFVKSADHRGVIVRMYGLGQPFGDWKQTHITECLKQLHEFKCWNHIRITHVLFTDASDVIFLQGMYEIEKRYVRLGSPPMLVAEELDGMNAGGWMGEIDTAIAIIEFLSTQGPSGNPQTLWREAIYRRQIHPVSDHGAVIFAVGHFHPPVVLPDSCLLHFAGGYTDPLKGKSELMEPIWRMLNYER